MKVFAFSGSLSPNSTCEYSILKFIEYLKIEREDEIKYFFEHGNKLDIKYNNGEGLEFQTGFQSINDDMEKLEDNLLDSDIVIFATPIYLHNVSGFMKNFIDRIGYWTHLLKLTGKVAITISCCDSNGVEYGTEYLSKMLMQLGCSVESNIEIHSGLQSENVIDSILKHEARKVSRIIDSKKFNLTEQHEEKFNAYKDMYLARDSAESRYWKKNSLFEFNTFEEYFYFCNQKNTF